jgi:hypothetical protein
VTQTWKKGPKKNHTERSRLDHIFKAYVLVGLVYRSNGNTEEGDITIKEGIEYAHIKRAIRNPYKESVMQIKMKSSNPSPGDTLGIWITEKKEE